MLFTISFIIEKQSYLFLKCVFRFEKERLEEKKCVEKSIEKVLI